MLIFIHVISFGQSNRADTIQTIVDEIAHNGIYERSYSIGYFGSYSKQLELFEKLRSLATPDRLIELAEKNKSPVVRLYAFQALKEKKTKIPERVVQKISGDNTEVVVLWGCFADRKTVRSLAVKPIIQQQSEFLPSQATIQY